MTAAAKAWTAARRSPPSSDLSDGDAAPATLRFFFVADRTGSARVASSRDRCASLTSRAGGAAWKSVARLAQAASRTSDESSARSRLSAP